MLTITWEYIKDKNGKVEGRGGLSVKKTRRHKHRGPANRLDVVNLPTVYLHSEHQKISVPI
jgi:hypothetical protein